MLDKLKDLKGFALESLDGKIGSVAEFYFDDRHWTVRYLVADTGSWLTGRQVLISPFAITSVNREERTISVNLTKKRIEDGPSLENHTPVSRQFEQSYHAYYGWPTYWDGPFAWGSYLYVAQAREQLDRSRRDESSWDHHLRSTRDVTGNRIQAEDGDIGHVEDFILDDNSWIIRYLIVDTGNWWSGKSVLVSPLWIDRVGLNDGNVTVLLSREDVRGSPEYTQASLLTREYESRLHEHYHRLGYWDEDRSGAKHTF